MAVGTIYWSGGTSTAWTLAANWTAGTSTSTVPIAGDTVLFDQRTVTNQAISAMAVGDTGGIDYALLHIKKGHTGTIGAAGSPLHTSAQKILIEGSGTYYIEVSENAVGADQIIPLVIINNSQATVYLTSNQNDVNWCCEFTEIVITGGTVYIGYNGSATVDTAVQTLRIKPQRDVANNAIVYIKEDCERYKATAYKMSIYMQNGTVTSDSAATLIDMTNGTFNYGTDLAASPETGMDITTLQMAGGTFNWYPDDAGDPYIANLWVYGGTFDASGTTNNDRTKYIGAAAGNNAYLFAGASMKLNNGMGNIKLDSDCKFWNYGGTLIVDQSTQVGLTYDAA